MADATYDAYTKLIKRAARIERLEAMLDQFRKESLVYEGPHDGMVCSICGATTLTKGTSWRDFPARHHGNCCPVALLLDEDLLEAVPPKKDAADGRYDTWRLRLLHLLIDAEGRLTRHEDLCDLVQVAYDFVTAHTDLKPDLHLLPED